MLERLFLLIFFGKEKKEMAVIYAALIIKGKKTLEQVPAIIPGQVVELLKALEVEV